MTAFESYIASGGRRAGFWRVLLGALVIGLFWVAGTIGVLVSWGALNVARYGLDAAGERLASVAEGGDPMLVAVMLLTFAGVWLGVFITVRLLHGQRFWTLFAPDGEVRTGDLLKGLGLSAAFALASVPVGMSIAEPVATALPGGEWLAYALALLALVFVQATAEELMFRGYLLQQLALRSRNPLVWAGIPSALFGALHWANAPTGELAAYYVGATFLIGLALAALVWKTGSLWASIGVHVGFNAVGLTVVGTDGLLSGAQLYLFPEDELISLMRIDLVVTALMLAFILSRWAPFGPPGDRRARA
jgi:membrane protease YdiL (CAAX protease family)